MIETTSRSGEPARSAPGVSISSPNPAAVPTDALPHLITRLLAPMFLAVSGGDLTAARQAAAAALDAYAPTDGPDLLTAANVLAFGLAALDSLSLAMVGDVPIALALRLRSNANALNRSAERSRRIRGGRASQRVTRQPGAVDVPGSISAPSRPRPQADGATAMPGPPCARPVAATAGQAGRPATEASRPAGPAARSPLEADGAPAQPVAAEAVRAAGQRSLAPASRNAGPDAENPGSATAPPDAIPVVTERPHQGRWAVAMPQVAGAMSSEGPRPGAGEHRRTLCQASALSGRASALLSGVSAAHPIPGGLATAPAS